MVASRYLNANPNPILIPSPNPNPSPNSDLNPNPQPQADPTPTFLNPRLRVWFAKWAEGDISSGGKRRRKPIQDESFLIEAEDMRDNKLFDQAVRGGRGWGRGWGLGLGARYRWVGRECGEGRR